MAMQVLIIIIQLAGSNFLVFYSDTGISKLLLHSGVDLGFTERTTLSIESLKRESGGCSPSEAIEYLILLCTKIPCIAPLTLCMNILIFL